MFRRLQHQQIKEELTGSSVSHHICEDDLIISSSSSLVNISL